jgi:rare lipoprotein A
MHALTAAHPSLPFGTRVLVTNVKNGRSVEVRINDRGPIVRGRIVDLSYAAAQRLGAVDEGGFRVELRTLSDRVDSPAAPPANEKDRRNSALDEWRSASGSEESCAQPRGAAKGRRRRGGVGGLASQEAGV